MPQVSTAACDMFPSPALDNKNQRSASLTQAPTGLATMRPEATATGPVLPASNSHRTSTKIPTAMPPISEAVERLRLVMAGVSGPLAAGQRIVDAGAGALQVPLHEPRVVAVEDMAQEAAIEIAGAEQPIGDRIGQVHVARHHDALIVVRDVMAADGIHEGDVPDDPVVLHVSA